MSYAGVEKIYTSYCRPRDHTFAYNGICDKCGATKQELIRFSVATIEEFGQGTWTVKEVNPTISVRCSKGHFGEMKKSNVNKSCPMGDGGIIKSATVSEINEYTIAHGGRDPLG